MIRRSAIALLPVFIGATSSAAGSQKPASCAYNDRIAHDVVFVADCGWVDVSGRPHVKARYWKRFVFDERGLGSASFDHVWYWFHRSGRSAPTMMMDNWAEDFRGGLARSPRGARIGYIDRTLKLVIPARYDGALPFENGVAAVCRGCTIDRSDEHSSYQGGRWFCVDRRGREWRSRGPDCRSRR